VNKEEAQRAARLRALEKSFRELQELQWNERDEQRKKWIETHLEILAKAISVLDRRGS
jgi:hypothetical protein